jgi:hypothetical protein
VEFPHPKFSVTCLPQIITIGRDEFPGIVLRRSLARVTALFGAALVIFGVWLKARSQERFLIAELGSLVCACCGATASKGHTNRRCSLVVSES